MNYFKYGNLMESFALEYWPCAILKLGRERNINFDLEESYYFWKLCCFLTHRCMIGEWQTVVIETEAEIGVLERDFEKSTCEYVSTELRFDCPEKTWAMRFVQYFFLNLPIQGLLYLTQFLVHEGYTSLSHSLQWNSSVPFEIIRFILRGFFKIILKF